MFQLRDFQALNKAQIRQAFTHDKHVLYQAGTGSGKTVVASSIIKDAEAKGSRIWFVAHRRELIEQTQRALAEMEVRAGIIMAGFPYNAHMRVQACSIDTLRERLLKNKKLVVPQPPNLIIVDEAHRSLSRSYLKLFEHFPDAYLLGLTATPIRSDGRGLGHVYDSMVQAPSVAELIEMGYLVQPRYFTGATANLQGVRIHGYDYARGEMEARMNNADLRGDVVEQWLRHGEGRKSIVFASGVKHSKALQQDFTAAGVRAMHIDGRTLSSERMDMIQEFRYSDKWQVLCNCMIVTEGFDVPEVGCVSIACPTKIISRYLQMGGRCLRPNKETGKTDCIIIDHGSNIMNMDGSMNHGFLEDPVPWELGTEGRITDRMPAVRDELARQFECHMCGCVFAGQVRCPECGTRLEVQPQHELISTAEELIEVTRGALGVKASEVQKIYTQAQKMNFLSQVKGYAGGMNSKKKTYADGWVGHTYRAKFGEFPKGMGHVPSSVPEAMTIAFINAKFAAYHIRRGFAHG